MTVRILQGDVFARLAELPDESVHCVVTSPPYWGLRSYGDLAGEIGREPTLDEHIDVLVRVFREVRRVLRSDGTCWINYGDAYAHDGKWGGESGGKQSYLDDANRMRIGREKRRTGLKPKDLIMLPARLALALQADGWWVRSEIIWAKPNPMPESATDRPTSAHEKIYLLTKSARYFYDAKAVQTAQAVESLARQDRAMKGYAPPGQTAHNGLMAPRKNKRHQAIPTGWDTGLGAHGTIHLNGRTPRSDKQRGHSRRHAGFNGRWDAMSKEEQQAGGANLRNIWLLASEPFRGSHYATFPPALVETCLKAGTSEKGACSACGAPLVRLTSSGWALSCDCEAAGVVPCVVLDPFGGAGTTGLVADRLGRDAILIELNESYVEMARARIRNDIPLFNPVQSPQEGEETRLWVRRTE